MPELARFFGIIIRMYAEAGPHHRAHFHAYYGEHTAVFGLDPIEPLAGSLPGRQASLVEEWAAIHVQDLQENWRRLQDGYARFPIDPLR
jgi:Domain of unknown function (DUF4160)